LPLKIAIDGRCLTDHYPGIGRYLFNLLRTLPRVAQDVEISVFTTAAEENSRFDLAALEALGVRLIPVSSPIRGARQQLELPSRMRELEAAVFHAPYFLSALKPGRPMVVGIYDTIAVSSPGDLPSLGARLAVKLGTRLAVSAAHSIITLSRAAQKDIVEAFGLPPEKVAVTPAAPAPQLAPAGAEAIDELRARLKLPDRYALHVGTNKPHKNLGKLMEAWSEVRGFKLSQCGLVFAGAHDRAGFNVREAAQRLGFDDVRCLGAVAEADLPALYSGALFFVLPSLVEGFGFPVLEAMACGVAVACARGSSLPEVAGHAAAYFDPADSGSIAQTLARLLRNPGYRRMLAERGLARAAQLSWERTARLTLDVYRRAAG
jgi:glycosyltransferase involved in cell wall biosynthesis